MAEHYSLFDTCLGPCGMAWADEGVRRLQLPEASAAATEQRLAARSQCMRCDAPPEAIVRVIDQVRCYAAGEQVDFSDVALDLAGVGAFYRGIYDLARRVRWGQTSTYGTLARQAGAPGAARAVGQAMGHNPVPIIIPCHRVLAAGGKVGGFSAFGGVIAKQRLLALEGVHLRCGTPLLPGLLPAGR
jgi:methylated-DNA-[protein]-cysteine S-methyltransferase